HPKPSPESTPFPWQPCLLGVWLTGSAAWLALVIHRVRGFRRLVSCARAVSADTPSQVDALAKRLGLTRTPQALSIPQPMPPLPWARGQRPKLFLPSALWQELTGQQQAALLAHELAHLKRGDHWVRYLELLVTALYWWHPVVWWACRKLREVE